MILFGTYFEKVKYAFAKNGKQYYTHSAVSDMLVKYIHNSILPFKANYFDAQTKVVTKNCFLKKNKLLIKLFNYAVYDSFENENNKSPKKEKNRWKNTSFDSPQKLSLQNGISEEYLLGQQIFLGRVTVVNFIRV